MSSFQGKHCDARKLRYRRSAHSLAEAVRRRQQHCKELAITAPPQRVVYLLLRCRLAQFLPHTFRPRPPARLRVCRPRWCPLRAGSHLLPPLFWPLVTGFSASPESGPDFAGRPRFPPPPTVTPSPSPSNTLSPLPPLQAGLQTSSAAPTPARMAAAAHRGVMFLRECPPLCGRGHGVGGCVCWL